jgi:hypothetical protein
MSATSEDRLEGVSTLRFQTIVVALAAGTLCGAALVLMSGKVSPVLVIGALCGAFLFVLTVRRPSIGLLLTAAVVPIERLGRLTDDSTMYTVSLMRIAGMLALGALFVNAMLTKRRFEIGLAFALYAIFVGFSVLSVTYTGHLKASVQMVSTFLGNLMFLFLIVNLARDKKLADQAIAVWLVVSVLTGVYAAYDWHLGSGQTGGVETGVDNLLEGRRTEDRMSGVWEDRGEFESLSGMSVRRSMGPTSHAIVYGINLILTLPFFLYWMRKPIGRWTSFLLYAGLAIVLYNILLTNTRGAMLLTPIVLILCVVRGLWVLTPRRLVACAFMAAAGLFFVPADVYNRALDLSNYSTERSATMRIRFAYWEAALDVIRENWLLGVGTGNENALSKFVRIDTPEQAVAHNDFLQTMMEVGVLQGCVFFAFLALLLYYAFRGASAYKRRSETQEEYWFLVATQIAMIATVLYGLQVGVFHFPLKGWWLIAGLVCVYFRESRRLAPRANSG